MLKVVVDRGELTLHIAREHLIGVAQTLRDDENLRFELCSSVSGVDYLGSVQPPALGRAPDVDDLPPPYPPRGRGAASRTRTCRR